MSGQSGGLGLVQTESLRVTVGESLLSGPLSSHLRNGITKSAQHVPFPLILLLPCFLPLTIDSVPAQAFGPVYGSQMSLGLTDVPPPALPDMGSPTLLGPCFSWGHSFVSLSPSVRLGSSLFCPHHPACHPPHSLETWLTPSPLPHAPSSLQLPAAFASLGLAAQDCPPWNPNSEPSAPMGTTSHPPGPCPETLSALLSTPFPSARAPSVPEPQSPSPTFLSTACSLECC